jgi:hypothetical protein
MDRSRPFTQHLISMAFTFAAFAVIGLTAACDSGTQEPDAPEASNEFGAAPGTPAAEPSPSAPAAPRDGSIASDRFPSDLPDGIVAEIPHNFPSNIPIYPGAQPAQGRGAEIEGSPVSGVQLLSNDDAADVFSFYETELRANGWEITESENSAIANSISATNGSCKAVLFIQASPKGGSDIFVLNEC